jgi:translation elongation factor P
MRFIYRRLSEQLCLAAAAEFSSVRHTFFTSRAITTTSSSQPLINCVDHASRRVLSIPWFATQLRGAKLRGADVRPGNVIERKGRKYQVVKSQHTQQGRGGACIQVELRDIDSGSKLNERFRTDETIESIFVEEKHYTYLYTDDETESVVLMEPNTYVQLDVPKHLFGNSLAYLKDDMKVIVELYDDRPMSASVPNRVTCKVAETRDPMKGIHATPQYKKAVLDNGLTVQVPGHVEVGDNVIISTIDNSYMSRA